MAGVQGGLRREECSLAEGILTTEKVRMCKSKFTVQVPACKTSVPANHIGARNYCTNHKSSTKAQTQNQKMQILYLRILLKSISCLKLHT